MQKIAIITDTASDLSIEQLQQYNIKMLHYQIIYKEKTLKDQLEVSSKEVLDYLEQEIPSTSLPALEEMSSVLDEVKAEGYKEAIVITLSSGLSGCYNAMNMIASEYEGIKVHVYDSKTLSAPQGVLAVEAAKMAAKDIDSETILKSLDEIRSNQKTLFVVDTLKYLLHGGRIGRVSATVGTLLNLKPIITIGDDGKYETITKVRGRVKAVNYFVNMIRDSIDINDESKYQIYFSHAKGEDFKDKIIKEIEKEGFDTLVQGVSWISPVACVHCGPGYMGMLIQKI